MDFWSFNPGAHWQFGESVQLDVPLNKSRSWFFREAPTILVSTPLNTGIRVDYSNVGGDFPVVDTAFDLNDPNAGWSWAGGRVNIQNEKRLTKTAGAHLDLRFGVRRGKHQVRCRVRRNITRHLRARQQPRWEEVVCGDGPMLTATLRRRAVRPATV